MAIPLPTSFGFGLTPRLQAGDVPKLLDDAVELGFLHATVDRAALLPVLERVFSEVKLAADAYQRNGDTGSGNTAKQSTEPRTM